MPAIRSPRSHRRSYARAQSRIGTNRVNRREEAVDGAARIREVSHLSNRRFASRSRPSAAGLTGTQVPSPLVRSGPRPRARLKCLDPDRNVVEGAWESEAQDLLRSGPRMGGPLEVPVALARRAIGRRLWGSTFVRRLAPPRAAAGGRNGHTDDEQCAKACHGIGHPRSRHEAISRCGGGQRPQHQDRGRRVRGPGRPVRVRQDNRAAPHRRSRGPGRRRDPDRRSGRERFRSKRA